MVSRAGRSCSTPIRNHRSILFATSMEQRPIPRSGETLPVIGLGTWQTFDLGESAEEREPAARTLERFASLGGRVIDTSPMYDNAEEVVGALRHLVPNAFIATKVWTTGREKGIVQMERSMERLRSRTIDLMQVHNLVDWRVHLETLRRWKAEGRIRYLGVTHYTRSSFDLLEPILRDEEIDFVQLPLSIGLPDAAERLLPLAAERNVAVIVNRPFEEGQMLQRLRDVRVPEWTRERGLHSWSEIAIRWIVSHESVTCVIPATRSPEHVAQNIVASGGPPFSAGERAKLVAIVRGEG